MRGVRQQIGWALPWLLFLGIPLVDLVSASRPGWVQLVAGAGLVAFTTVYLRIFAQICDPAGARAELALLAVLGATLPLWLGPAWLGLPIYVASAAAAVLPERWAWAGVGAVTVGCAALVARHGLLGELFILPLMCVLSAFALRGTRYLMTVNAELARAREELARSAVAEERLRFARDLHDLLGHSLSLIALKSELAGRLAVRDPQRAREEMADVESAARRALAEVRDAVSGYRSVGLAQALAEARPALAAAGITLHATPPGDPLPAPVDTVLGWVVREATTNVLRHSDARTVDVELRTGDGDVRLAVTDDGRGGDAPAGAGLAGLAERVEALGGTLSAGPPAGDRGFRLAAVVPVAATDRVPAP